MKIAPANTLRTLHVLTLLSHTCLYQHLTATVTTTTNYLKLFSYKFRTHTARVSRAITAQPHAQNHRAASSHETEFKMGEKEAVEVHSKFRSEFLQVLRSRRTTQGSTSNFYWIQRSSSLSIFVIVQCSAVILFISSRTETRLLCIIFSSVNRWSRKTSDESFASELSSINRRGFKFQHL